MDVELDEMILYFNVFGAFMKDIIMCYLDYHFGLIVKLL